jgi:low temperature requirement protein LtrA
MKYAVMPVSESHLVERFGLFTIIVLGESVAGIVNGLAEMDFRLGSFITATLGLLLVFAYWWIYFENIDGSALKGLGGWSPVIWLYSHLPLVMSLTAVGISVEHIIAESYSAPVESPVLWLMTGALSISFLAIAASHIVVSRFKPESLNPQKGRWRLMAAVLVILIGVSITIVDGTNLLFIGLLTLASFGQIFGELFVLDEKTESDFETTDAILVD